MHCLCPDQRFVVAIYIDTGLTGPYSATQWRCQCSAWRGWPPHSMCSSPHWQVGQSWFREKIVSRGPRTKAIAVSKFREKLSYRDFAKNIAFLGAKKRSPTCDRDISDSAIYTTAIYRAYTVLPYQHHTMRLESLQLKWTLGGSKCIFNESQ